MATYSVYNIKVDNLLSFTPGATAGYVLAIDSNGNTYWSAGGGGSQTLAQTLALGNSVGTYSITSPALSDINLIPGSGGSVVISNPIGNFIAVGQGTIIMGGTTSFQNDILLPITSSVLATDESGRIIATSSAGGSSGTSGVSGSSGTSGVSGSSGSSGTSGVNGATGPAGSSGSGGSYASYSVSGSFNQNLSGINVTRLNLTGNTSYNFGTASTNGQYSYLIEAGANKFNLGTYSNYKISTNDFPILGATGAGLSGSFILRGLYDGDAMWIKSERDFFVMPKPAPPPPPPSVNLGNMLAIDAGNATSYSGSGATWNDLSGNSNTVTLNGGYGYSSADGGYITFNGTSAYGQATHNSTLNATSGFSIEFWVNHVAGDYIVASKAPYTGGPDAQNGNYMTWLGSTYHLFISNDASDNVNYYSNYDAVVNTWQQLVFTYDGTNAYFYKNGATGSTGTVYGPAVLTATTENLLIGKRKDGYGFLDGKLSIVNLWNYAITHTQIATNFNEYKSRYGL